MVKWHIIESSSGTPERLGPFTAKQLKSMIDVGSLPGEAVVEDSDSGARARVRDIFRLPEGQAAPGARPAMAALACPACKTVFTPTVIDFGGQVPCVSCRTLVTVPALLWDEAVLARPEPAPAPAPAPAPPRMDIGHWLFSTWPGISTLAATSAILLGGLILISRPSAVQPAPYTRSVAVSPSFSPAVQPVAAPAVQPLPVRRMSLKAGRSLHVVHDDPGAAPGSVWLKLATAPKQGEAAEKDGGLTYRSTATRPGSDVLVYEVSGGSEAGRRVQLELTILPPELAPVLPEIAAIDLSGISADADRRFPLGVQRQRVGDGDSPITYAVAVAKDGFISTANVELHESSLGLALGFRNLGSLYGAATIELRASNAIGTTTRAIACTRLPASLSIPVIPRQTLVRLAATSFSIATEPAAGDPGDSEVWCAVSERGFADPVPGTVGNPYVRPLRLSAGTWSISAIRTWKRPDGTLMSSRPVHETVRVLNEASISVEGLADGLVTATESPAELRFSFPSDDSITCKVEATFASSRTATPCEVTTSEPGRYQARVMLRSQDESNIVIRLAQKDGGTLSRSFRMRWK